MPLPRRLALLLLAGSCACSGRTSPPAPSPDATSAQGAPKAEVYLRVASGAEVRVAVELALTEAEQARGLMFRRALEPGAGMLFVFRAPGQHKFWMRNTYIPLDMIFVAEDRKVVYVEDRAEPLNDTPRGPDSDVRFVVEVPGGWAKTHGIEPGATARFVGVPGLASP
jgi:uncharacterized protein